MWRRNTQTRRSSYPSSFEGKIHSQRLRLTASLGMGVATEGHATAGSTKPAHNSLPGTNTCHKVWTKRCRKSDSMQTWWVQQEPVQAAQMVESICSCLTRPAGSLFGFLSAVQLL